jgi:hypothetical protein
LDKINRTLDKKSLSFKYFLHTKCSLKERRRMLMFGFLLNLFNSDLDSNCENSKDEELNRSAIEIWQKDNDWKYDYQDEDLWDNFLGQGYDYDDVEY